MPVTIRELRPEDKNALVALWLAVFGGPAACVEEFLRFLPEIGSGVAAFENGWLLGAAYMVTALQLREGEHLRRCGYLYAVGVDEKARGRGTGAALSQAAAALGRERGAETIAVWPAEPGLYPWYERVLGARCALFCTRREMDSAAGPAVRPLPPEVYGRRREELLVGQPHLVPAPPALGFEAVNLSLSGGGLFAVGEGIAAASVEGGLTVVRELLGAPPEAAAALGAALGTPRVRLWQPSPEGEPFLACVPAGLPRGTVWNLAYD